MLVGGGLQSCLAALALRAERPDAKVLIVEREAALCGNHTWCLHDDGLPAWLAPAIAHRWDNYDVRFERERTVDAPYVCVTSASLAAAVGCDVALSSTEVPDAPVVLDARGPGPMSVPCGYQKFVGLELAFAAPHGVTRPMIMDASVPQVDGYRFMYVLPFDAHTLLVEDTYYSDSPTPPPVDGVLAYARRWGAATIVREERGCLPLPLELPEPPAPFVGGYAGGWFHPTTGYSFPMALRVARFMTTAHLPDARERWQAMVDAHRRQQRFALRLNRMLFRWFAPEERHNVLARFYRLPEPTIARFYALQLTAGDRARIICGRPPRGMSWRAVFGGRA